MNTFGGSSARRRSRLTTTEHTTRITLASHTRRRRSSYPAHIKHAACRLPMPTRPSLAPRQSYLKHHMNFEYFPHPLINIISRQFSPARYVSPPPNLIHDSSRAHSSFPLSLPLLLFPPSNAPLPLLRSTVRTAPPRDPVLVCPSPPSLPPFPSAPLPTARCTALVASLHPRGAARPSATTGSRRAQAHMHPTPKKQPSLNNLPR